MRKDGFAVNQFHQLIGYRLMDVCIKLSRMQHIIVRQHAFLHMKISA